MDLDAALITLLLSVAFSSSPPRQYEFVRRSVNCTEAQRYCRQNYRDLASVSNSGDLSDLLRITDQDFWIGLLKTVSSEWSWSLGDPAFYTKHHSLYRNWAPNQTSGSLDCAYMDQDGLWRIDNCTAQHFFICYNDTIKGFVPVLQMKSWRSAQSFCRANHVDLTSVRNQKENQLIQQLVNTSNASSVWIGLFRDPWEWSDKSPSSFRNWASGEPDGPLENATVMVFIGQRKGQWEDWPCVSLFPFVCYEDQFTLVKQNLSWAEAMQYCRQNHVDLVSVTSEQIERRVRTAARNASTPAVWMGLHHYCAMDMWLWLRGEVVCYQSWAAGDGAGPRDCSRERRVGAMQTAGDQRWVSLPPARALNFICSNYED
ncbi:macrophage mannose receptor 1-like [Rhinichthys klamathensis goyatoka]|uniref:macrophage mannose receptor 1-like n=1 Tax=Rhinichthys klamathensis goyatoka TaxID=3034132 RepID=UPI0024B4EEBE|nr:macrophage mannose receptor 1-like [Rhinichthys klamathensis goyatoka]